MSLLPEVDPIEVLRNTVQIVSEAETKQARIVAVSGLLQEGGDLLGGLVGAEAEALLLELSGAPGAGAWMPALRRASTRATRAEVVPLRPGDGPADAPPDHPHHIVPDGYRVAESGVWQIRQTEDGPREVQIAHAPILVTGAAADVDTGAEHLELSWRRRGRWTRRIVSRGTAMDARALITLADDGAPVHSATSRALAGYLAADEAAQPPDTVRRVTGRLGWHGDGFLLGNEWIGEDSERVEIVDPSAAWVRGYHSHGTYDGWVEAITPALAHPSATLALWASCAAPLFSLVPDMPNAILDWSGETSHGKTTVLRLALSVWARPDERDGALMSWATTWTHFERSAARLQGVPLCLDDTQRASSEKTVADILYGFASGVGKGRATVTGTQDTSHYRGLLLSTGERPASTLITAPGARARVLSLTGIPFGDGEQAEMVTTLTWGLGEHYGVAGPRIIGALLGVPVAEVRDYYRQVYAHHQQRAGGGVAARMAGLVAMLDMGRWVAHDLLGLPEPDCDPMAYAERALGIGISQADVQRLALEAAYSWAVAHQAEFWGRHVTDRDGTPRQPHGGWVGRWDRGDDWTEIAWLPDQLDAVLDRMGYSLAMALPVWAGRGWIVGDRGRTRSRVQLDGERVRVVRVARSALDG